MRSDAFVSVKSKESGMSAAESAAAPGTALGTALNNEMENARLEMIKVENLPIWKARDGAAD